MNSIVQSLSELRDIERQRVADELAAIARAEAARAAAQEAAERRSREEAEAREKAEREARLAEEQARAAAEREERMRRDAAGAAELARQQVALEHTRVEGELALRREEVSRTRPTWMVAVMGLSLAAAGGLLWLALSSRSLAAESAEQARLALLDRDASRRIADEAQGELGRIQREVADHAQALRDIQTKIAGAKTAVQQADLDAKARKDAERQRAIEDRLRELREKKAREDRLRPVVIPEECKRNTFARGCPGT